MPRFYYEFREMDDDSWEYVVFDRRRGSDGCQYVALTVSSLDAEMICDALNATARPAPPPPNIFG